MIKYLKTLNNIVIAELTDDKFIITQTQDILNLISDLVSYNCVRIIIHDRNLHADFLILKLDSISISHRDNK